MQFEDTPTHEYQTFIDILTEMVSIYMERQSEEGESRCARDDAKIQQSKQSVTD